MSVPVLSIAHRIDAQLAVDIARRATLGDPVPDHMFQAVADGLVSAWLI
ncbi:hypothetical protein ACYU03_14830 [Pseudomonas sp. X10]